MGGGGGLCDNGEIRGIDINRQRSTGTTPEDDGVDEGGVGWDGRQSGYCADCNSPLKSVRSPPAREPLPTDHQL